MTRRILTTLGLAALALALTAPAAFAKGGNGRKGDRDNRSDATVVYAPTTSNHGAAYNQPVVNHRPRPVVQTTRAAKRVRSLELRVQNLQADLLAKRTQLRRALRRNAPRARVRALNRQINRLEVSLQMTRGELRVARAQLRLQRQRVATYGPRNPGAAYAYVR